MSERGYFSDKYSFELNIENDQDLDDDGRASIEIMYTPSASRWFDWYFSAGGEKQFYEGAETGSSPALELGVRIRPRPWIGLKVGTRANAQWGGLTRSRLVGEFSVSGLF